MVLNWGSNFNQLPYQNLRLPNYGNVHSFEGGSETMDPKSKPITAKEIAAIENRLSNVISNMAQGEKLRIGRAGSENCEANLSVLSREHAKIERTPDNAWTVMDTNSQNGTWVLKQVKPGERVSVSSGDYMLLSKAKTNTPTNEMRWTLVVPLVDSNNVQQTTA